MIYAESKIQRQIVRDIRYLYPQSVLFSVPNEGRRNPRTASIMKANGILSGVSDLILLHKGKCYFIEVKAAKGTQTVLQREFADKVKAQGFEYHIVRSSQELVNIIEGLK